MLDLVRKILYCPLTPLITFLAALVMDVFLSLLGSVLLRAMLFGMAMLMTLVSTVLNFKPYSGGLKGLTTVMCLVMAVFYFSNLADLSDALHGGSVYSQGPSASVSASNHHPGSSGYSPEDSGSGYYPEDPGTGYYPEDNECYFCKDTGDCHVCHGEGGMRCSGCNGGRCKYCHGSGQSSGYGVTGDCGGCGGDGKCNICRGTGVRDCNICYGSGNCTHC